MSNIQQIENQKQALMKRNSERENSKRIQHTYRPGDKVLVSRNSTHKYEQPYDEPCEVLHINANGTVQLQMGAVSDIVSIRRIHPYKQICLHSWRQMQWSKVNMARRRCNPKYVRTRIVRRV